MLEAVGQPVAVNADRELRREAEERGWQTRDFRKPVRLRDRLAEVPTPSARTTVVAAAVAVAAFAAWLVLRRAPRRAG
jgi:hypothetical protein